MTAYVASQGWVMGCDWWKVDILSLDSKNSKQISTSMAPNGILEKGKTMPGLPECAVLP